MKHFLVIVGFFLFSCGSQPQVILENPLESDKAETTLIVDETQSVKSKTEPKKDGKPEKVDPSVIDNVEFDFQLTNGSKSTLLKYKLKGFLTNNNNDTVYFLSKTCYSEYASLEYDESKFMIFTGITCIVSNPIIYKIAPNESHSFETELYIKQKSKSIKLGFDFYAVTKDFRLKTFDRINIFSRSQEDKTIIWAKEKTLRQQNELN